MSTIYKQKQTFDGLAKVAVIGDSSVGKTNILLSHVATIGIDFKVKTINLDGYRLKMQIWDTAGQQRFRNLTGTVYQGAQAILLVYSIVDRKSFQNVEKWMLDVHNYAPQNTITAIIGNKVDLNIQRTVKKQQGIAIANNAKDNINIQNIFQQIALKIKQKLNRKKTITRQNSITSKNQEIKSTQKQTFKKNNIKINNDNTNTNSKKKGCC